MCAESRKSKSHCGGFVYVLRYAVFNAGADQKLVLAVENFMFTHAADIEVEQSIIVDIHYRDACAPAAIVGYMSFGCRVGKLHVAFIQEQFVAALVGCKK